MDLLINFAIVAIFVMLAIARLMLWLTNKTASDAITSYFQEAEYILEHHQAPTSWTHQTVLSFPRQLFDKRKNQTNQSQEWQLAKMDELIRFFEHCPFFEDEQTREILLQQLADERKNWEQFGIKTSDI